MTEYIKAGKLVAAHGLKGEVIFKHSLGKKTALPGLQALFIEDRKESFLPWFIESAKAKTADETYIKIKDINSREQAALLVSKEAWLRQDDFEKQVAKTAPVNLLGYTLIEEGKPLGIIEELMEQPHQMLCRITINNKEVLIPLHEETLKKIDRKAKQVFVSLPAGLLEIYL